MDLADIIRDHSEKIIRKRCTEVIKKPALIEFFLRHENLKLLRKNLKLEIFGAELKYGARMDRGRVEKLVEAGVDIFMHGALESAKLQTMSRAERGRQETENGREKESAAWYEAEQKALKSTAISASTYIPSAKEEKTTAPAQAEAGRPATD